MKDIKKLLIGTLSVLVVIMAIGYALLAQELTINGTASIDSLWKVEITNITSKNVVGDAVNKTDPTYTTTTANFSVGFTQPGDSITYDIEVTNSGTLDAVVTGIDVSFTKNQAIKYTTSGIKRGNKLAKNGSKQYLTIKVEYDNETTSQPTNIINDINVTINYEQDLGQVFSEYVYTYHTNTITASKKNLSYLETIVQIEHQQLYEDNTELIKVRPYYLRYRITDDKITERAVCFVKNNNEYCLVNPYYEGNYTDIRQTLISAFGANNCPTNNNEIINCNASGLEAHANSSGYVDASVGSGYCFVDYTGSSQCGN